MSLIEDLFRQNEWANLALLDACRGLSEEQFEAGAEGTYGSVRVTLLHFLSAESSYVRRLGGRYEGPSVRFDAPLDLDLLAEVVRGAADGLIERAQSALRKSYFIFESAQGEEIDAEVVLAQALNHSTEHRAHICTVLTTLGMEPPALDGWTWGEQTGRIRPRG